MSPNSSDTSLHRPSREADEDDNTTPHNSGILDHGTNDEIQATLIMPFLDERITPLEAETQRQSRTRSSMTNKKSRRPFYQQSFRSASSSTYLAPQRQWFGFGGPFPAFFFIKPWARRKCWQKLIRIFLTLILVLTISINVVFMLETSRNGLAPESKRPVTANGHVVDREPSDILPTNRRSNQLKLQQNLPKFLTIEVLSSQKKVSVTVDGTTVSVLLLPVECVGQGGIGINFTFFVADFGKLRRPKRTWHSHSSPQSVLRGSYGPKIL